MQYCYKKASDNTIHITTSERGRYKPIFFKKTWSLKFYVPKFIFRHLKIVLVFEWSEHPVAPTGFNLSITFEDFRVMEHKVVFGELWGIKTDFINVIIQSTVHALLLKSVQQYLLVSGESYLEQQD